MKLIIGIGGTGIRVAHTALHLLASGVYKSKETVHFIALDKDTNNGNASKAESAHSFYKKATVYVSQIDSRIDALWQDIKLDDKEGGYLSSLGGQGSGTTQEKMPEKLNRRFKETNDSLLLNWLFSEEDQDISLEDGFKQKPAVGALYFETIIRKFKDRVLTPIFDSLPANEQLHVFLCGSLFGGTGAALIYQVAKCIRDISKSDLYTCAPRVCIGGAMMLPYFMLPLLDSKEINRREEHNEFRLQTRDLIPIAQTALASYSAMDINKLVRTKENATETSKGDVAFDALYPLGLYPPCNNISDYDEGVRNTKSREATERNYQSGGGQQKSRPTLTDLLAAQAACHFFTLADTHRPNDENDALMPKEDKTSNLFITRFGNSNKLTAICWDNLPNGAELRKRLLVTLKFSLYVTTYLAPLHVLAKKKGKTEYLSYLDKEYSGEKGQTKSLESADNALKDVFNYALQFIEFIYNVAATNDGNVGSLVCELLDTDNLKLVLDGVKGFYEKGKRVSEKPEYYLGLAEKPFNKENSGLCNPTGNGPAATDAECYDAETIFDLVSKEKPKRAATTSDFFSRVYHACEMTMGGN